jgi:hypothetical protein
MPCSLSPEPATRFLGEERHAKLLGSIPDLDCEAHPIGLRIPSTQVVRFTSENTKDIAQLALLGSECHGCLLEVAH